ncbi:hypothetical protein A0H81_09688 [Grifola frondosa]|uniref:Uncharacterized protein n=1 Tax=Grifola frondosa TaxID=5627 RepID=A0A1C7M5S1_GRIFR|nr:hypothetical protein A0H81_09688 [Grifola frondosa]
MLTAIPEVDLGMDTRLKNIEETEKAKRQITEERKDRRRKADKADDEEHLAASRFYRPNLKAKRTRVSAADRAKQMATDELVMERFKKRMRK